MGEAFRLGGWGMYPTLFIGVLLVGAAVGYAVRPERLRLKLVGEALHNVALGLGFVVLAGIAGAIGLARGKRGAGKDGSLVDPFA